MVRYLVRKIPNTSFMQYDGSRMYCEIAGGTAERATVNTAELLAGSKYLDVQTGKWYVYSEGQNAWTETAEGGSADPAVIEAAVQEWLNAHPEATTTVADGSITEAKLASSVAQKVNAVTQLSDEIDDVKSAVNDLNHDIYGIENVTPTVADGRGVYYGGSTASIVSAQRTSVFFPISVGLTYHVKTNGEVFRLGFATDSDITPESTGNYLFDYQNLDGETEYTFTVSNGNYTFCYITYKYQDNQTATIEIKQSGIGVADVVTKHTSEINAIDDQIKPKETIIAQDSYIDYRDGRVIGNYPGLKVTELKVADGMAVIYDYTYSTPDIRGLAFFDVYGRYISGAQVATQTQTINVPGNACTCCATVDDIGRVKLLYVSDAVGIINEQVHSSALKTYGNPLDKVTNETGLLDLFLNVGCIGDSLASGESYYNEGGTPHAVDLYQYSWGQFLARKTGNTYYNFSAGGLSTRTWLSSEYATECFDGEHNCQAYIIGLGQNDANANIPIGTSADIKTVYSENPDTFYGNYGKIIQKIKETVPKAKIFVITDMNASTNTKGYNAAIRNMANIFENVYVLDFREYGLKYYNLPIVAGQMRQSHYNAFGYKLFSMMIANYINWIMVNHYDEFTQVEFIDSTHSWTE